MSDIISRKYLLALASKDGAYGYVDTKQIAEAPPIEEREAVMLIWSAQIDDLIGKIEKLSAVHLGTKLYLKKADVLEILEEAKK